MTPNQRGFTLVELVIVVAVVGILAAVAFPSYQEQTRTARRADAAGALAGLSNAMERYFTQTAVYTGASQNDGNGDPDTGEPDIFSTKSPIDGADTFYNLAITAATATTYALEATRDAAGPQAADRCGELTLNQAGTKGMRNAEAGMTVDECWR